MHVCVHTRTHTGHNLLLSPHAVFHQLDMCHELTEINEHIRIVICHFLSFPPIPLIFPAELPEKIWLSYFLCFVNTSKTQTSRSLLPPEWSWISHNSHSLQRWETLLVNVSFRSWHFLAPFTFRPALALLESCPWPGQRGTFVLVFPSVHSCVIPRDIFKKSW